MPKTPKPIKLFIGGVALLSVLLLSCMCVLAANTDTPASEDPVPGSQGGAVTEPASAQP